MTLLGEQRRVAEDVADLDELEHHVGDHGREHEGIKGRSRLDEADDQQHDGRHQGEAREHRKKDSLHRIVAEGNVHQIRDLIDTHPHTVFIRVADPRTLARTLLVEDGVISMRFEPGALVVETARPDAFYARVTQMAASGEAGAIDEVTSPDDNLQAVFQYLVKQ